jgi:SPP1 family predicted phage head-tail adaptor
MKPKAEAMKDLARVRRRRITIQHKRDDFDNHQNPVEHWRDWRTIHAERTQLYGKEYYAAAEVGQEQTVIFTARYVPFLDDLSTVHHRLTFDGKAYDIKHVDHLPGETWVKIRAIERPGDD